MAWQVEQDNCEGRGFSGIDTNGFCAKFYTWITKNAASGGPGWTLLRDESTIRSGNVTSVDYTTNEELTITSHGFVDGDAVRISSTGSIPGGLQSDDIYYVKVVDGDTIKLCHDLADVYNNSPMNLTSAGSGTITVTMTGPFIIVGDRSAPGSANDPIKAIKFGYDTDQSGYVQVQHFLSWDASDNTVRGLWAGYLIRTLDSATFAYDFRGNTTCLAIQSYIASESASSPWYGWYPVLIDEWTGFTNFVDPTTVEGTTQGAITAGASNVVVELASSAEASAFTKNQGYFIYDFVSGQCNVAYGIINAIGTADGLASDAHIRFSSLCEVVNSSDTIAAGAIVTPYKHRFYATGRVTYDSANFSNRICQIPYCSYDGANDPYAFHYQNHEAISLRFRVDYEEATIFLEAPGDDGSYAVQKPAILESYNAYTGYSADGSRMNRRWGEANSVYLTDDGGMSNMQTGRTIDGKDYICLMSWSGNLFSYASNSAAALIQHTEET